MFFVVLLLSFQACYEDFKVDFEYTTSYFARQFPLRTLVEVPGEDMTFEVGAALGGKYSNDSNEQVVFAIQDSFLNADNFPQFTRLPDNYYTLETNTITIPSGKFFDGVTVTLNEQFLNDPLSHEDTYALPVEITSATTDSILDGKHYSVIVVKYINQYQGWYYVKGTDTNNSDNSVVTYSNEDLVLNEDELLLTVDRNTLSTTYVGEPGLSAAETREMTITVNGDNTVTLSGGNGAISNVSGSGTYDPNTRGFTFSYTYTDGDGNAHTVVEELIYRNTEIIFEEWQ